MSKWIAEFELEDGDKMPEHMDLEYMGARLDFHCRPMWIPVSEKLPEEKGLYLVSVKNDHERRYSKTCWFHGKGNWFARQDVEAWMPLPEPYDPQKSDIEKLKPCINYEDGCEEWAGCPCVYYKAESEPQESGDRE